MIQQVYCVVSVLAIQTVMKTKEANLFFFSTRYISAHGVNTNLHVYEHRSCSTCMLICLHKKGDLKRHLNGKITRDFLLVQITKEPGYSDSLELLPCADYGTC